MFQLPKDSRNAHSQHKKHDDLQRFDLKPVRRINDTFKTDPPKSKFTRVAELSSMHRYLVGLANALL